MPKVRVVHDGAAQTLAVWLDDPSRARTRTTVAPDCVLVTDADGKPVGLELSHYTTGGSLTVETVSHTRT